MTEKPKYNKVGDIRPSQLLYSYGIGALADLPGMSVIVLGVDSWDKGKCRLVHEPRLLQALRAELGDQVKELRLAPAVEDEQGSAGGNISYKIGIPVSIFPTWVRCSACNRLLQVDSSEVQFHADTFRPEQSHHYHANCLSNKRRPKVLPVRFMVACKSGHLHDFPWISFVHRDQPCFAPILRIIDDSATGDATQITVTCTSCNTSRRLVEAIGERGKETLPACDGHHPHLPAHTGEDCQEELRTIAIGASNLWFPNVISALSIPKALAGLAELVQQRWSTFVLAESEAEVGAYKKSLDRDGKLGDLKAMSNTEIWQCIVQIRSADESQERNLTDLKGPEYAVLAGGSPISTGDFRLRYVAPPAGYEHLIQRVGLVERLREVRALTSFSRLEAPGDGVSAEVDQASRKAPISASKLSWVPVSEVRGEGLFIQFSEEQVSSWCDLSSVRSREQQLRDAHVMWQKKRKSTNPGAGFPGIRYVLLHSFAHALMRQLALDCGYTSASIRERVYAQDEAISVEPMAGVLLYTAAPDSEGTLGGLVSLGDPAVLGRHIAQALEGLATCASDPLCSEHKPEVDGSLHGAACHSCLFASETSCERGNKYLDRATIVDVMEDICDVFFNQ